MRADIVANIRAETGELRITNSGSEDFVLEAYEINSATNELRVDDWLAISDEDAAWLVLAEQPNELAEGVFQGDGRILPPGEGLYLGAVWGGGSSQPIDVLVVDDVSPNPVSVSVAYLPAGDYDENGVVDHEDYEVWKDTFGTTGVGLLADGNRNQIVDLADYTIWRDHLGATMPPADTTPFVIANSVAIPEPCASQLITMALVLGGIARRRLPTRH